MACFSLYCWANYIDTTISWKHAANLTTPFHGVYMNGDGTFDP